MQSLRSIAAFAFASLHNYLKNATVRIIQTLRCAGCDIATNDEYPTGNNIEELIISPRHVFH